MVTVCVCACVCEVLGSRPSQNRKEGLDDRLGMELVGLCDNRNLSFIVIKILDIDYRDNDVTLIVPKQHYNLAVSCVELVN